MQLGGFADSQPVRLCGAADSGRNEPSPGRSSHLGSIVREPLRVQTGGSWRSPLGVGSVDVFHRLSSRTRDPAAASRRQRERRNGAKDSCFVQRFTWGQRIRAGAVDESGLSGPACCGSTPLADKARSLITGLWDVPPQHNSGSAGAPAVNHSSKVCLCVWGAGLRAGGAGLRAGELPLMTTCHVASS